MLKELGFVIINPTLPLGLVFQLSISLQIASTMQLPLYKLSRTLLSNLRYPQIGIKIHPPYNTAESLKFHTKR